MFLILSYPNGGKFVVNSDDISTFAPAPDGTHISYRDGSSGVTVAESFDSLVATLRATMPESVGTVPAVNNVLIHAVLKDGKAMGAGSVGQTTVFDADKIDLIQSVQLVGLEHFHTQFTHDGREYLSIERYAAILNKIQSVKGK